MRAELKVRFAFIAIVTEPSGMEQSALCPCEPYIFIVILLEDVILNTVYAIDKHCAIRRLFADDIFLQRT